MSVKTKGNIITSVIYAISPGEVTEGFKILYGVKHANEKLTAYYLKKLKLSAVIAAAGIVGYFLYPHIKAPVMDKPYAIERNDYGGGTKTVNVGAHVSGMEDMNLDIAVHEIMYTDEEFEHIYEEFEKSLYKNILSSNISFDHVEYDLRFVNRIEGYPFSITYKTDKPAILSYSGKIDYSKISDSNGELVNIIATVKYDEFKKDIYIPISIFEKEKTEDEKFSADFKDKLDIYDEESKYETAMKLPGEVAGRKITYFEKGENIKFIFPVIGAIFAVMLFIGNNDEIKKEVQRRNEALKSEYPVLINRFAVFYNAGIPISSIWNKLCSDYVNTFNEKGEKNYLYEEMLVTQTMISDGKSELAAYEDFSKRCGLKQYKVFVSLLQQAITKGKSDMGELLKREAEEAFIERKNIAKAKSEEASSKLLLPMFMMLIVVMIMIMFPAFKSFN